MIKFTPTKENYIKLRGKKVKCGRSIVEVAVHRTESRGGTWATGFRFYNSEWAMLKRISDGYYSMDHAKTWHPSAKAAAKSKGKMKLSSSNHGEFAFDGIQNICREYEGPGYRWKR